MQVQIVESKRFLYEPTKYVVTKIFNKYTEGTVERGNGKDRVVFRKGVFIYITTLKSQGFLIQFKNSYLKKIVLDPVEFIKLYQEHGEGLMDYVFNDKSTELVCRRPKKR